MNWFLRALNKYADFTGRAQRAEYWYFVLFYVLIYVVLAFIDGVTGTYNAGAGMGILSGIFILAILIPSLSVSVRRLHDIDRTGWWLLIGFIPLIGGLVLFIFTVMDGTKGENTYGPDPKHVASLQGTPTAGGV